MTVHAIVYPVDREGCGHHRLIWPVEALRSTGSDVRVDLVFQEDRIVPIHLDRTGSYVVDVEVPEHVDVVVFQRVTHVWLVQAIKVLREKGIATVVDVDDDLNSIHPSNAAWEMMHPSHTGKLLDGKVYRHSWRNLGDACAAATLVTTSTPALAGVYAPHGRVRVLDNFLADHYYGHERVDSDVIGWPASLASHPDDPGVVGPAVSRLVGEGADFRVVGYGTRVGAAFQLDRDPPGEPVDLWSYPAAVAKLGIGICPLTDTRFNRGKSRLKALELSALGVPWVGSPRAEYRKLHALGCGVLAEKPRHWYRELRRLRDDPVLRAELSAAGREVAETQRLRDHAWRWAEAWSDAVDLQHGRRVGGRRPVAAP